MHVLIPAGTWVHLAVVACAGVASVYLNGERTATSTTTSRTLISVREARRRVRAGSLHTYWKCLTPRVRNWRLPRNRFGRLIAFRVLSPLMRMPALERLFYRVYVEEVAAQ